ncbi:hypothetical protein [Streptomyces sp. CBMA29]|uniref:hypothetical protein n=1 Tax=Streptomyces sp. CBMA29 TaxID=1896314 RepID=UPI001661E382|nr:hypothetical protein [Streptomyces sp. CBMA29]
MSDSQSQFHYSAEKALACATAVRVGGALYILSEASGLDEDYYGVDAGIQSGMVAASGRRELNQGIVRGAIEDCNSLSSRYLQSMDASAFFVAGVEMTRMVLEFISEVHPGESLQRIKGKALEAAGGWPSVIDGQAQSSLLEFEIACQGRAEDVLAAEGVRALREAAGADALGYRRAAQALR